MSCHEDLLKVDFGQCFEQMRHYDSGFMSTIKFMFTGYAAVLTTAGALLSGNLSKQSATMAVGILLLYSGIAGTLLLLLLLRNRVYYVIVARFVNVIRATYMKHESLAVGRLAGIYSDPKSPKALNLASAQLILLYFAATSNSLLYGASVATMSVDCGANAGTGGVNISLFWPAIVFIASLACQVALTVIYLKRKDMRQDKVKPPTLQEEQG